MLCLRVLHLHVMKQILFLFAATTTVLLAAAQTRGTATLYGYVQSVSGGKAPEMAENGTRTSEGSRKNYRLYAASTTRVYPVEIWIEGERYGLTAKSVEQTPVEAGDDANIGSPKVQLVPKTTRKVVQLVPLNGAAIKSQSVKAKSLATQNAVVFVYRQNGKLVYSTLKKLAPLQAAAMQ